MEKSANANQWIFPHFNRLQQQQQQQQQQNLKNYSRVKINCCLWIKVFLNRLIRLTNFV